VQDHVSGEPPTCRTVKGKEGAEEEEDAEEEEEDGWRRRAA
jgi:hypothetical protein